MAPVILLYEVFFFGSLPLSSCLWYCCQNTEIAEANKMHDFVLEDMLCNNHTIYSQSFAVGISDNLRKQEALQAVSVFFKIFLCQPLKSIKKTFFLAQLIVCLK